MTYLFMPKYKTNWINCNFSYWIVTLCLHIQKKRPEIRDAIIVN
jgi:hypothetical protein